MSAYPATLAEVLEDGMRFNRAALAAVRLYASSGPWSGSTEARQQKLLTLNAALSAAYGIPPPAVTFHPGLGRSYRRSTHTIILADLSVVTYLHEFGHARGYGERGACRWSLNLFRRVFPRQFARCEHWGHMLVRR